MGELTDWHDGYHDGRMDAESESERLRARVSELEDRQKSMAHTLTRIAEWAETADADEFVNGLPQTAKIARDALDGGSRDDRD